MMHEDQKRFRGSRRQSRVAGPAGTLEVTLTNDDGDEERIEFPARFEVCDRCLGHGTHLHPAIGEHAYSPEEFGEAFDEEERVEYFTRGGRYDVVCQACKGERVVKTIDRDRCERDANLKALLQRHEDDERMNAEIDAMVAMERSMGA